jgi:UrcA family protein
MVRCTQRAQAHPAEAVKEQAMRKTLAFAAALAVLGLAASPAAADDKVTVSVPYADLNLAAPAGEAQLDQRINAAVNQVCAKPDIRNLKAMTAWEECKANARVGALDQLSVTSPYDDVELASVF